jgi:RNA polymerase sigma factor (sigma-70 family)
MDVIQRGYNNTYSKALVPNYLKSFPETFVQFEKMIYHLARKFTSNPIIFKDLVQEGYLGLHKAVEIFDIQYNNQFSTFAYKYIEGYMRNFLTKNSRWQKIDLLTNDELELNYNKGYEEIIDDKINIQNIYKAISLFPKRQAEILKCYFVEDLSVTEISDRLLISKQRVSKVLNETINVLRNNFNLGE